MAAIFKNTVVPNVSTVLTPVLFTTSTTRATVLGLSLANTSDQMVYVDVAVEDDAAVQGYYAKNVMILPGASLRVVNGGERLMLANNNRLLLRCSDVDSVDAVVSYVETA